MKISSKCFNIYWICFTCCIVPLPYLHLVSAKTIFNTSTNQNVPITSASTPSASSIVQPQSMDSITSSTAAPPPTTTAAPAKNRDIKLGPCVWAIERTCPDPDVNFYLYTRRNPIDRQYIQVDNDAHASNLSQSHYDKRHPSKILIHGYNADMFLHPLHMMRKEYLAKGEYNIFFVDWSKLAIGPCYISAVHNIRHTGACVAKLVERIVDMGSADVHVIGFSLGGQLGNYIAKELGSFVLPRITALDPAMPLFVTSSNKDKLDPSDAEFVDVIHTNAMVQGKLERCGHADFYLNGGIVQPGCSADNILNPFACSHHRAIDYFLESIRTTKGFWGWSCSSYIYYLLGMCPPTNYLLEAGENVRKSTKGMFFINTNDKSPYALGKWTDLPTLGLKQPNVSAAALPSITIVQPMQRGDPLLKHIDQWGKLDYNFNNFNDQDQGAPFAHDPYEENWTYFSGERDSGQIENSVEEQGMEEYQIKDTAHNDGVQRATNFEWLEYKRNISHGFIENSIFSVPELVGR